jgi:hypothetical protein
MVAVSLLASTLDRLLRSARSGEGESVQTIRMSDTVIGSTRTGLRPRPLPSAAHLISDRRYGAH